MLGLLGTKLTLDDAKDHPIDLLAVHIAILPPNGRPLGAPTIYLRLANHSSQDPDFNAVEQPIDLGALAAGRSIDGWIGFWVPRAATSGTLVLNLVNEPDVIGELPITWARAEATP